MDEFDDYPVDPRSDEELESIAEGIRNDLGFSDDAVPTAVQLLAALQAKRGVEIIVKPDDEMGRKDAYTTSDPPRIFFSESTFTRIGRDEPRARMTVAHEIFHHYVHPGAPKARMAHRNTTASFIRPAQSAERQARVGGAVILMSRQLAAKASSAAELQASCRVSEQAARIRFERLQRKTRRRPELAFVREHIDRLRSIAAESANGVVAHKIQRARALWETLKPIQGRDPNAYRMCSQGLYMIAWVELDKMTQCGWFIRNGKAVASITLDRE